MGWKCWKTLGRPAQGDSFPLQTYFIPNDTSILELINVHVFRNKIFYYFVSLNLQSKDEQGARLNSAFVAT